MIALFTEIFSRLNYDIIQHRGGHWESRTPCSFAKIFGKYRQKKNKQTNKKKRDRTKLGKYRNGGKTIGGDRKKMTLLKQLLKQSNCRLSGQERFTRSL